MAGFVLANGSMTRNSRARARSASSIVEADLVDCMIALPGQLFYTTQIPVCLWFLARDKTTNGNRFRDRRGETLFIDARKLGTLVDRTHRELTDEDIARIAETYHAWRGENGRRRVRRRARLLQERHHRGDRRPRLRAHARPLRRRRGGRGRRRAVRGEDEAADASCASSSPSRPGWRASS